VQNLDGARPCLKYIGGKRKLVPEIRALMPKKFGTYWEPFFGGGAVFFSLSEDERKGAVLSDTCEPLMAMYAALRKKNVCEEILTELGKPKYDNTEEAYYAVRKRNFLVGTPAQRAADFLYCNRAGFNGLFRTNLSGQFNVPFGRFDKVIFDEENLRKAGSALAKARVVLQPFEKAEPQRGDLVYFDPPYLPLTTTSMFTQYTPGGFGLADHERLMKFAMDCKKRGVHIILSNCAAPVIREMYEKAKVFEIREVQAARAVNSKADGRGKVTELLIR
jgi:DNA adenine methylase